MRQLKIFLLVAAWLGCFYFAEANWAASFCHDFCGDKNYNVETPESAVRSGLIPCFVGAPLAVLVYWSLNSSGETMWDWPRYLHFGFKQFTPLSVK